MYDSGKLTQREETGGGGPYKKTRRGEERVFSDVRH